MRKIWISGAKGQLGKAINRQVDKLEYEMLDTDIEDLDITDLEQVQCFGEMNRPDIIINCSGMTDLDDCENNPGLAYKVNALGARNLGIVAKKQEAKLVQISTDDVFDGRGRMPYNEFEQPNPCSIYGKSKLAGENYVKEFTYKHFIIRSSWVYGDGDNFVRDFLKKADSGEPLSIPADQYGSPTSAKELAVFLLHLVQTSEYGTYHATNQGVCSRYEYAEEILKITGKTAPIHARSGEAADSLPVRPSCAVLENFLLDIQKMYKFPHWRTSLEEYLKEGTRV